MVQGHVLTQKLIDARSQLFGIHFALIVRDAMLQNCWDGWTRPVQAGVSQLEAKKNVESCVHKQRSQISSLVEELSAIAPQESDAHQYQQPVSNQAQQAVVGPF